MDIEMVVGGADAMRKKFGTVTFVWARSYTGAMKTWDRVITVGFLVGGEERARVKFQFAHELGHIWDQNSGWELSKGLQDYTHADYPTFAKGRYGNIVLDPGSPGIGPGSLGWPIKFSTDDHPFNKAEDFANSFAAYIYPDRAKWRAKQNGTSYSGFRSTPRGQYIEDIIWPGYNVR